MHAYFLDSKTKGLFAGVSLEGSVIMERKDANKKFYGGSVTGRQLLSGSINPPPDADDLIRILNSRVFSGNFTGANYDDIYNDIPKYDNDRDPSIWEGQNGRAFGESEYRDRRGSRAGSIGSQRVSRSSTWQDDVYDREGDSAWREAHRPDPGQTFDTYDAHGGNQFQRQHFQSTYSDKGPAPGRPTAPKPVFKPKPRVSTLGANQAVALYTFEADQPGDLGIFEYCAIESIRVFAKICAGFKKGDIITITKKTDSKNVCSLSYACRIRSHIS
jgi:hypothetical protein